MPMAAQPGLCCLIGRLFVQTGCLCLFRTWLCRVVRAAGR
jgi:hypothetical protein